MLRVQEGPLSLVMDLCIAHDRWKILQYRADYNNRPPHSISFMLAVASTVGHLHCEFVLLLFLQAHRETHRFNKNFFQFEEFS